MERAIICLLSFAALLAASPHNASAAAGASLPGTEPLNAQGDLSAQMVAGIDNFLETETTRAAAERGRFWKRDFSSPVAYEQSIATNRARLRHIIGAEEKRLPIAALEFTSNSARSDKVAESARYSVHTVRWPVLPSVYGEGLWIRQKEKSAGLVICIPDADQTPEMICGLVDGLPLEAQFARHFAEQGFEVLVPVLVDRSDTFSGNEELGRFTNQPHREWVYRQAYELGGHIIGYEVLKVLSLADWLEQRSEKHLAIAGYAEGGMIAFYAAALDPRFQAVLVSGYFGPREKLWQEPIYRNVFGLLDQFGDAEIATLIAPRLLTVEYSEAPRVSGPPAPRQGRSGAAPGRISTPERFEVEAELDRAREFFPQNFPSHFELVFGQEGTPTLPGSQKSIRAIVESAGAKYEARSKPDPLQVFALEDSDLRQKRQVQQLVNHAQHLLVRVERERNQEFWSNALKANPESWSAERLPEKTNFWQNWIGQLPEPQAALNARSRQIYDEEKWVGHEVTVNVYPGVFAWGILCVPKDLKPGEKRPVVVCQHGLEGLPKDVIEGPESQGYHYYKAFAARLAERGFVTFAPHNPYRGRDLFRVLQRKANPLGKSLFSVIIAQHQQILNWLETLPFVDDRRIGFYGLSYGGKTAMRVPAVLDRYAVSICSADFNDWVKKNATVDSSYSYMFSNEYEMPEFALGRRWNYAEMAALIAPRPFMVERGHEDGVAPDEWVAYEFAKVKRFYDKLQIGDRARLEVFDGPHSIHGVGTFQFLHQYLNWPEP